jgi:hypothetical protein
MNKIVTLAFSLILTFGSLFSQKIDYDNSSKWYLGFNFGGTWQTTDVKNRTSGGWGLTLGRSYNYNYGKRLTFDIRGRYLGGYWYGQDLIATDSAGYSGVALKPYMDSLGFAVNNFQTELHNLSLELVLHANGVRERSGWDPYIFGGFGVKWHQTFGDLLANDTLGGIYNYDPSLLSKSYISSMTDGIYETALDGSDANKFSASLMPSLGFGIGYQVGKRVTIGLEHKTTFTLADDFDGFVADGKYKQDLYHYTSAFINFRFRRGGRGGGSTGGNGVGNIDNYNNNTNNLTGCNPPVVTYIQPASVGLNVNTMTYTVIADVKEVIGKENITFKHNGISTLNFTYNPTTDRLEAQVILTPGSNTFEIYATNTCGSDTEGLNVNYQNCVAPVISLVSPSGNSTSVSTSIFAFSAFITNVDNPQGLVLTVNNRSVTNYTMNSTTGSFQANLNLIPGTNTVVITATNACGTATQTVTINYQNCVPPVITVLNPATGGSTVNTSTYTFNATVQNVTSSQAITLKQNNAAITNFSFNASTGIVQNNVTLKPGLNTFIISATNGCGADSKTVTINYTRELNNTGGGNTGGGNQEQTITICHYPPGNNGNPQTIEIPLSAWPAHQAHGDKLGPCDNSGTGNVNNGGGNGNNGGGNQEEKITICHYPPGNNGNPQTIEIPLSAWPAHQAHGDKLGPCPEVNNNTGGGNQEQKITICHYPPGNNGNPQTIEIPLSAWPAHQAHGDKLGPCDNSGTGNGNNGGGNGNNGGGNQEEKITICHYPPGNNGNPQTIEIPLSAWPAHQAHGDKLGPCDNSGTGNGNNGGGNGNNGGGNSNNGNSGNNGDGDQEEKITICHYPPGNNGNPQTIEIPLSAWPAHQAHGDKLGPCDNSGTGNGNNGGGNVNNGGGNSNNGNSGINGNNGSGNSNNGGNNGSNSGGGNEGSGATNGNNSNNGNAGGNNNNGGGNGNNGHGNNADGIDSSNPGQGNGGPNGGADGSGDDENGNSGAGAINGASGNVGGSNGNNSEGSGSNGNGSGQNGNNNGSGSNGNGSTENGSEGSSTSGNGSNENGSGQNGNNNGSGSNGNGSAENGSEGSSTSGNGSNENGSGQNGNNNGSSSNGNGSTENGSNGSSGNGGNGGGGNKAKSTGTNNGTTTKPGVKPAGTKINDQKPGTPKPSDKNETKPSGAETKPGGVKTEKPAVKPTEIKPGTGGGKGGK